MRWLTLALLLATGCAEAPHRFAVADLDSRAPRIVAVLPFDNESVSLTAPERLRRMVFHQLTGLGYSSMAIESMDDKLRTIGVTDGGQLKAYQPKELGRVLDSPGLLYGNVEEFTYQNVGFILRRAVRLKLWLVEAATGEKLWESFGEGADIRIAGQIKDAEKLFLEGVIEQAAEGALQAPLALESKVAVETVFQGFPKKI